MAGSFGDIDELKRQIEDSSFVKWANSKKDQHQHNIHPIVDLTKHEKPIESDLGKLLGDMVL